MTGNAETPAPQAAPAPKPLLRRWWVRLLLVLLVLLGAGYFARNLLVRKAAEVAVTSATGFPLSIDSFDLGLLDSRVEISGMRLSNPEGFEDPRCLDVPRVVADVELLSALGDRFHVQEVALEVKEVVVVRNARGDTNLDHLRALGGGGEEPKAAGPAPAPGSPGPKEAGGGSPKWRCDRLRLKIGRVQFLDFSRAKGGKPKTETFDIRLDETLRDIDGPEAIVKVIVLRVLQKTPVRLARASVDSLRAGLKGAAEAVVEDVVKDAGKTVEGLGDALGGALGGDGKKAPPPKKKR